MITEVDVIFRLFVAIILGGIVGYERQARNKAAGLRTHMLVSLGSCLIMIVSLNVSLYFFMNYGLSNADPERIAAQVVSGIGFLGAGTIFANKKGFHIIGLTTAASLWVVAAIGLAAGAGYWISAGVTTFFVYLILTILSRLDRHIKDSAVITCHYGFAITATNLPETMGHIGDYLEKKNIKICEFKTVLHEDKMQLDIYLSLDVPNYIKDYMILADFLRVKGIVAAKEQ